MEVEHIPRDFGPILGAGLVAEFVATFLRVAEMIVLVAVGAQLLFYIGVALMLFHGRVGISLRVSSRTALGLGLLDLSGVL